MSTKIHHLRRCLAFCPAALLLFPLSAAAVDVRVTTLPELRAAIAAAKPGDVITIAPGEYPDRVNINGLCGTANKSITLRGERDNPPVFQNATEGLHFSRCAYLLIQDISVRHVAENGINIDDGGIAGSPTHHITLERIHVEDVGAEGIHNGIKLSGLDDFEVRDCDIAGWGGSAIDLVGCHKGLIESCRFTGQPGYSQHTGPQLKGGTADVTLRACFFDHAGARAINIGGTTGLQFFRPPLPDDMRAGRAPAVADFAESRRITVEGCTFVGSETPIAFVGADAAVVRYNTFIHPEKWIFRILQENTAPGFIACRDVSFNRNLILFRLADLSTPVNISPNTQPKSFKFDHNFWYADDAPAHSRLALPARETNAIYGQDPRLQADFTTPKDSPAHPYGAQALPLATQPTR